MSLQGDAYISNRGAVDKMRETMGGQPTGREKQDTHENRGVWGGGGKYELWRKKKKEDGKIPRKREGMPEIH